MIDRTVSRFMRYANCASESHNEKAFCEYMEQELMELGVPFERQYLGNEVVTNGWNILAKIPGREGKKPFLFVFHLDTVGPGNYVEAYIEEGHIRSKGNSVLGADGKLAIAVVMEAVSRLKEIGQMNRPIEMLFTVCQELGFHGTKHADYSNIDSEEAVVMDHYVTGEVLLHTPSRLFLHVELIGHEAHVIRDEDLGVNALLTAVEIIHQMPIGHFNENQRINIFDLVSLSPSNTIPKHARFDVEVRSFGNDLMEKTKAKIYEIAETTAGRRGCKCNIREHLDVPESDFSGNTDMLKRLSAIYAKSGIPMLPTRSFGFMDATVTDRLGIRTIPIGINIYYSHSTREFVVVEDIKKMLELAENIIRYF